MLSAYYLGLANANQGKPLEFSDEALALMQVYDWPGNVTELRNVIDWLSIMVDRDKNPVIRPDDLPPAITGASSSAGTGLDSMVGLPLKAAREHFETQYLISQLTRFDGNISKTASFIGMERSALHRKLKSLNINPEQSD